MRFLVVLFFLLYSSLSFSAPVWSVVSTFATLEECKALYASNPNGLTAQVPPLRRCAAHPRDVAFGRPFANMYSSQGCDAPAVWNSIADKCVSPCVYEILGELTSPDHYLDCINDCEVIGDPNKAHVCITASADNSTVCKASYVRKANFCPQGLSNGVGTPTTPSSTASTSSSASTSGGGLTGNGTGTGTGTGSGTASSSAGNTGTGTGTGTTGTVGNSSGGGDCDTQPSCSGDSIGCAQIIQAYLQRCPHQPLGAIAANPANPYTKDLAEKLTTSKQLIKDDFARIKNDLTTTLHMSISAGAAGLPSNIQNIKGVNVELGIYARRDFFSVVGSLFVFASVILAAYIIFER